MKTTLALGEQAAFQVIVEAIEQDASQDLPNNGEQGDATVVMGGGTYHSRGGGVDSIMDTHPLSFHISIWICVVRL